MSYGLFDGDLQLYPQIPFFNLELMKYSTYFKRKREIVVFTPTFNPSRYSNYLVRQDYFSRQLYSIQHTNILYGGRAFDGENYKPLPIDIEMCRPDTTLYNKLQSQKIKSTFTSYGFNTMRRAEHVRLSLDGKTINPQWEKQLKKDSEVFGLILHDYDLGTIKGARELIADNLSNIIAHRSGARLGMKFPVQVYTEEDLFLWLQILPLNQYYSLQYNGIFTIDNIDMLLESKAYSSALSQIIINVTKHMDYQTFITTGITQLFKSILDLRRHRLIFPLKYDRTFFIDARWVEVMELIELFIHHINRQLPNDDYFIRIVPYETLYSYVKKETKRNMAAQFGKIRKQKAQRIFQFVREQNYELFKMFYEYTGELK